MLTKPATSDPAVSYQWCSKLQMSMFFGIDLTSSETKPSACLCLNDRLQVVYRGFLKADEDIVAAVWSNLPCVVAVDAPLSLPLGLCCLEQGCGCKPMNPWPARWCEQELARRATPCYFTNKKSLIKRVAYRGMALKSRLAHQNCEVIEVYPYASKVHLFGKPVPRKTTAEGESWLRERTGELLKSQQPLLERWSHDLCDAAIAAYTGFLYAEGRTEPVGDGEEGLIYVPAALRLDFL